MEAFCAFDWPAGRFRFDGREPFYVQEIQMPPILPGSPPPGPNAPRISIDGLQYINGKAARTPEYMVDWMGYGTESLNSVVIMPPETQFHYLGFGFTPFDVRTLGLTGIIGFEAARSLDLVTQHLTSQAVDDVERLPNGIVQLTTFFDSIPEVDYDNARRLLRIDVERGQTPVYFATLEDRFLKLGVTGPSQSAEVSWIQKNGAWVPAKFHIRVLSPKTGLEHATYDLEFEWESVNEPVADELFSYKSFEGLPKGTPVYDRRNGRVKLEVIGEQPPQPLTATSSPFRAWLVWANIVVVLVLLLMSFLRTRKRKPSHDAAVL